MEIIFYSENDEGNALFYKRMMLLNVKKVVRVNSLVGTQEIRIIDYNDNHIASLIELINEYRIVLKENYYELVD